MSEIAQHIRELIDTVEPFDLLPQETRQDLVRDITVAMFEAGQTIIEQGSGVHRGLYIVASGSVRLMDREQQQLLKRCAPGDFFGAFGLLKGGAAVYEARAVEPTACAVLSAARFGEIVDAHRELADYFERDLQRYVRRRGVHIDVGGAHLLFGRRLEALALSRPVRCRPDDPAQEVARRMTERGAERAVVAGERRLFGVVSDADFRSRIVARGLAPDVPVKRIMTRPAETIRADATLFDALMRMLDRGVNHLVVVPAGGGEPLGVLTDRDVAHFRGKDPLATVQYLRGIDAVASLAPFREETNEQLQSLFEQGVPPEQLSQLMAALYDRIIVRVIELVADEMRTASPRSRADLPWVWLRLGGGGRREMVLNSEQHHALLYANPDSEAAAERARAYFQELARRVTEALATCGLPTSSLVAADPRFCNALGGWKRQLRTWILQADDTGIADAVRFFDLRPVYGDPALVRDLLADIEDALNVEAMDPDRKFIRLAARHMLRYETPRNVFTRFLRTRRESRRMRFDLRARGILPAVEAARLLALELRYFDTTSTFDRLRHAADAVPELRDVVLQALDGYRQVVDFRLEHQLNQVEGGADPDDEIDLSSLTRMQQNLLQDAAGAISDLLRALDKRYGASRRR